MVVESFLSCFKLFQAGLLKGGNAHGLVLNNSDMLRTLVKRKLTGLQKEEEQKERRLDREFKVGRVPMKKKGKELKRVLGRDPRDRGPPLGPGSCNGSGFEFTLYAEIALRAVGGT